MTALYDIITSAACKMIDAFSLSEQEAREREIEAQLERIALALKAEREFRAATRPSLLGQRRWPAIIHSDECRCSMCCL